VGEIFNVAASNAGAGSGDCPSIRANAAIISGIARQVSGTARYVIAAILA
jgi:hypothetical protein